MELRLNSLVIENFKGIKRKEIEFADETAIYGQNGSGKSSIVDAFFWLLFDSDSKGNAPGSDKFHSKPLGMGGQEVHNLDTAVTASCTLDGKPFVLKRMQRENWAKKRGSADAVYQGNVSSYWINEVETKATEFKERVARLASGDVFRLIASLGAFNALDWRKRRAVLLAMNNVDADSELKRREEFRCIVEEASVDGVTIDDLKKVLSDRKKRATKELQEYPARIDEVNRSVPNVSEDEVNEAQYYLADAKNDLSKLEAMLSDSGASSAEDALIAIAGLEKRLRDAEKANTDKYAEARLKALTAMEMARDAMRIADNECNHAMSMRDANEVELKIALSRVERLRKDYSEEYGKKFEPPEIAAVCPSCGQPIPEERQQEVLEAARREFSEKKVQRLNEIKKEGVAAKKSLEAREGMVAELEDCVAAAKKKLDKAESELKDARQAAMDTPTTPVEDSPEMVELKELIAAEKQKLARSPEGEAQALKDRIAEVKSRIEKNQKVIQEYELGKRMWDRVAELRSAQRTCGEKLASYEQMIAMVERFMVERCRLVEDSINDLFPTVKWKLFDTQINGGITECCECMILCEGAEVPYSGANTASCVNADIEIIGVLEKHYDVIVPVFVDNAERVNRLVKPSGQLITLSVSEDSDLRIEYPGMKEAA